MSDMKGSQGGIFLCSICIYSNSEFIQMSVYFTVVRVRLSVRDRSGQLLNLARTFRNRKNIQDNWEIPEILLNLLSVKVLSHPGHGIQVQVESKATGS